MRSPFALNAALVVVYGLSSVVTAHKAPALATITPCPDCPKSAAPNPITVTSQYQPVSTCSPETITKNKTTDVVPSCTTYDFVSTVIPCLGGASTTTITETDQVVELAHVSTVLTSYSSTVTACPTTAYTGYNGTSPKFSNQTCTSTATSYTTMIVDISAPYDECGPLALGNWGGSGLCKTCVPNPDEKEQVVEVSKCLNDVCTSYTETWISTKAAPVTTTTTETFTSTVSCSEGENTIPVTATFTPTGSAYSTPVTTTFSITTSVPSAQTVEVTSYITITYTAEPQPTASTSESVCPLSTSTYCSTNGVHTIPIVTTATPTGPGFTAPVTSTAYYTTTVTNAPTTIGCTTVITITFTSTVCPATVVSGTTYSPTKPASVSAATTTSTPSVPTTPVVPPSTLVTSTQGGVSTTPKSTPPSGPTTPVTPTTPTGPSATPSPPASVGDYDFEGCYGSKDGFKSFTLVETSAVMSVELCVSECKASGDKYAGLYKSDCYCAKEIDDSCSTEAANGICNLPCPGAPLETCGGDSLSGGMLFDVYECEPTPTTTTSTETSTETSATSNPSSDPDPEPAKREIDADMEIAQRKARDAHSVRRGGMLRRPGQPERAPVAKRDLGLKKLFGRR